MAMESAAWCNKQLLAATLPGAGDLNCCCNSLWTPLCMLQPRLADINTSKASNDVSNLAAHVQTQSAGSEPPQDQAACCLPRALRGLRLLAACVAHALRP